ncbi:MAG: LysM peptidoglycan-binding domain-containing protein [Actinomycetales bacterium]|nr:LysM peptidoglycan-binding domain-containing protein [Actinomycetales bacterium]
MSALAAWDVVPLPTARPPRPHLRLITGPQPSRRRSMRMTMRGRIVIAAAVLALGLPVFAVAGAGGAQPTPARVVTVQSGQTLSHVAAAQLPRLAIAEGVAQIQLANGMNTSQVRAGQELLIPALP